MYIYILVSFGRERWRKIGEQQLCKCCRGRKEGGRERGRKTKSKRERKKRKEREGRRGTTTVFIVEKGFGLAFCHPLLTSVQPFSGKFSNVCHPLRPFLLHGQCLSDRSPRQSHGNRDGFTVAGNPCRIYRLHSSGYVFLYLPFRISLCNQRVRFHGQPRVLLLFRLCSFRVAKTFFFLFFSFLLLPEEFSNEKSENFLISKLERIAVIHFCLIRGWSRIGQRTPFSFQKSLRATPRGPCVVRKY